MTRLRTLLPAVAALLLLPAAAAAQTPAPAPAPKPQAGRATIAVSGGQATRKLRYVATGATVRVRGTVKPFVAGQKVLVEVTRRGKAIARTSVKVGRRGHLSARIRAPRSGVLKVRLRHLASAAQVAFTSRGVRVKAVRLSAGQGSRGLKVLLLQRGLYELGYAVPRTGRYDAGTSRAVLAFRKVNGLGRGGYATKTVFSDVLRNRGAFNVRHPKAGRHVEFDWSRQVLALIGKSGRATRTYHASSGKASTPTVFGRFRFYRRDLGTNALGMVDAAYFIGGYAIHGYKDVPTYPASHGCIRVPVPNARSIRDAVSLGEQIFIYR